MFLSHGRAQRCAHGRRREITVHAHQDRTAAARGLRNREVPMIHTVVVDDHLVDPMKAEMI